MKHTLLALAAAACALASQAQNASAIPAALKVPLAQGLKVHKSFRGPSGLEGWVLLRNGDEPLIVFTTADGKTLLSGAALDEQGRDLVPGYVEAHAPKPDFSSFVPQLARAPAIVQGDPRGSLVLYAFFDPTCPFCNLAYGSFKASLKPGMQVRWIPIDYLSPKAAGQAAALLAASDGSAALHEHEQRFKTGGIAAVDVTPEARKKLDENLKLFHVMGFKGVPAILYRSGDGRWDALSGAPGAQDMARLLASRS